MAQAVRFILTLLLCWTISAFGQKQRIGFKLLPGLTTQEAFLPEIQSRYTLNFGGQYIQAIKDSILFIETGIYLTDRGCMQANLRTIHFSSLNNPYYTTSNIYHHNYCLSLPILIRIELKSLYTTIGPTLDYFLYTKTIWTKDEDKVIKSNKRPNGFKYNWGIGATLNFGKQVRINDRFDFFVEVNFNPSDFYRDPVNNKIYFFWNYLIGTGFAIKL